MRYHYKFCCLVTILIPYIVCAQEIQSIVTGQYCVRVLLDAQDIALSGWTLSARGGFIIYDRDDRTKKDTITDDTITVRCAVRGIEVNHKRYMSNALVIVPAYANEQIEYDSKRYGGIFLIVPLKGRALLINRVELEDYIFSVLRTESFPSWPLEVNKVFAIASRTYVISMILDARKAGLPYHIRNTNHHQTYTGIHHYTHLRTAVNETKGIFIAHNKKPIVAMFDVCCGGIVPAHVTDVDFIKAPYLARPYPCTFCKGCKVFEWKVFYPLEQLVTILQPDIGNIRSIQDIRVVKRDTAGLVKKVTIHGAKTATSITGKRLYRLLKQIRSFCFSAQKQHDGIVFTGRGYGHHIGICQWGAREMVRIGYDCREILSFYYPGTTCMRLQ